LGFLKKQSNIFRGVILAKTAFLWAFSEKIRKKYTFLKMEKNVIKCKNIVKIFNFQKFF